LEHNNLEREFPDFKELQKMTICYAMICNLMYF
jgi:hypothetical protein